MICSSLNLLFLMTIILRIDGLLGKITGTVYEEQANAGDFYNQLIRPAWAPPAWLFGKRPAIPS